MIMKGSDSTWYIIMEWFFLFWSFFINYILSFSLVGLWTIWLLVSVHRHWVQLTLARKGYDNHNCYNKPQIGNGLECEWFHAQKRWSREFEDFEIESWELTLGHVGDSWVVCYWGRQFKLGSDHDAVKLGPTMMVRSQKLINAFVPEQRSRLCIWVCLLCFLFVYVLA